MQGGQYGSEGRCFLCFLSFRANLLPMKALLLLAIFSGIFNFTAKAEEPPIQLLSLPAEYKISIYATGVKNARSLTLGKGGVVFVGSRKSDRVHALLPDRNGDGKSDGVKVIAKDLNSPNGVAYKDGDLYIAEISRLRIIRDVENKLEKENIPEFWGPKFPTDTHHGWKFIAFGPDGWLYVPVGAPCNVCDKDLETYAAIHRVSPDGKRRELVAKGIRNTVGFDWHPETKELWFTDNGRDMMGDDIPPCELNKVTKAKENFGFPYCHGIISDPQFGKNTVCTSAFTKPMHEFPAHSAPLGMRFFQKPKGILVAEHGSWNRSEPIGYQVTYIDLSQAKPKAQPFISGFLRGSSAWGRPVDVLEMPDGSILVSDDKADAVYRVIAN
jgi:glucose/arabinose dehydrogenase